MTQTPRTLDEKFDLASSPVLLNGTQALVRLVLMQRARDAAAGLDTAGYVTGYRGSPLGGVDAQMTRQRARLEAANVHFEPGLNEDLAATALWGSQQAELRGEGRFDGVFGLWYGKGPGVDRSGDVMRHVNMAGTSPAGGVLMALGDDHSGESSTVIHQSDFAVIDAGMPLLSPAGIQEILDYGIYGWALSRFCGLWVGLKVMKDTIESTAVVDGRAERMRIVLPDVALPEGGLNIRLVDDRVAQEPRLVNHKVPAAEAFARANRIDRRMLGRPGARIGFVAAGKNWLDLAHALELLGIDAAQAERLGVTACKIGQVWPLDRASLAEWAEGLSLIVVVEEKRKLIEGQIKEALFGTPGLRVWGGCDGTGAVLFPASGVLDPVGVAAKIGAILDAEGASSAALDAARLPIAEALRAENTPELARRLPYFCAGCPHNSSTRVPEGSRAYAGIGCHFLVLNMDRDTLGFTQMGGEGANWVGEAPFSKTPHVFVNIGDGTFNHSGLMAIRAAVAAGTTITYKILYNDAVAMTGGQPMDGGLDAPKLARETLAAGVVKLVVVHDEKEPVRRADFPGIEIRPRSDLDTVQRELREIKGVTALLYVQTCAAEKRRRRKRGAMETPAERVWINPEVCEGCGDCGVQSNCVALVPVETPFGRKRAVDQSACNRDFSCLDGMCPALVTVSGGALRGANAPLPTVPDLPAPRVRAVGKTWNGIIAGVGGTGVVTLGAILAQAAHLDGKGAAMIEMTGIAQKGGAVLVHLRIAARPEDITAIRVAAGEADALIGCERVVAAGSQTLPLLKPGRSGAVVDSHDVMTGAFTRDPDFRLPGEAMSQALARRLGAELVEFDATALAHEKLGDSVYSNMIVLGAAWQCGLVPLTLESVETAIGLNGQAIEANRVAFALGRQAIVAPPEPVAEPEAETVEALVALRAKHLEAHTGPALAARYRALVGAAPEGLKRAVARGYHKVLAVKDEYEVARLHGETVARVAALWEGTPRLHFHFAPPLLARRGANGRPGKRRFGPWVVPLLRGLARMRFLRGTLFDPFGYTEDHRAARALIADYEADMAALFARGVASPEAVELAEWPLRVRGYGPVRAANREQVEVRRVALRAALGL